jgi:hypothetical protein
MIAITRLLKDNVISKQSSYSQVHNTLLHRLANASAPLLSNPELSAESLGRELAKITSCNQLEGIVTKVRSQYFLREGMPTQEPYRKLLESVYAGLGVEHPWALMSSRNSAGEFTASAPLVESLLRRDLSQLSFEDFTKYVDLVAGISLPPQQLDKFLNKFRDILKQYKVNPETRSPTERHLFSFLQAKLGKEGVKNFMNKLLSETSGNDLRSLWQDYSLKFL